MQDKLPVIAANSPVAVGTHTVYTDDGGRPGTAAERNLPTMVVTGGQVLGRVGGADADPATTTHERRLARGGVTVLAARAVSSHAAH